MGIYDLSGDDWAYTIDRLRRAVDHDELLTEMLHHLISDHASPMPCYQPARPLMIYSDPNMTMTTILRLGRPDETRVDGFDSEWEQNGLPKQLPQDNAVGLTHEWAPGDPIVKIVSDGDTRKVVPGPGERIGSTLCGWTVTDDIEDWFWVDGPDFDCPRCWRVRMGAEA